MTLFLAEFDINGTLIYCNAGHPAGLLVRFDGTVIELTTTGMILGPNPQAVYSFGLERIEPGDVLAIYTDGITEAEGEGDEEYGRERLTRVLKKSRHLDPIAIVDRVFSDVDAFAIASPPADDQTLVVIRRRPQENEEISA